MISKINCNNQIAPYIQQYDKYRHVSILGKYVYEHHSANTIKKHQINRLHKGLVR